MVDYIRIILCNIHVFGPHHRSVILLFVLLRFSELGSNIGIDWMEYSDWMVYLHEARQVDRLTSPSSFRHNLCARLSRIWLLPRIH